MAEKVRKGGKTEIACLRKGCKGKLPDETAPERTGEAGG